MSEERTEYTSYAILPRAVNPHALDTRLEPVSWRDIRETIDPQGVEYKARELVDQTFTVVEFRPLESSYNEGDVFYWVKALWPETGELFHTTLGGRAVVDVLNSFQALNTAYLEALALKDEERIAELQAAGAGRPFTVKLLWKARGKYSGYYQFD